MIRRIRNYFYFKKHLIPHPSEIEEYINHTPIHMYSFKAFDIMCLYKNGHSLDYIAAKYENTRERIRQILCKTRRIARGYLGRRWL